MDQKKHAFIDGVKKSESDRQRLIMLASNGDAKAASELAQHFFLVEHNYERAKYWFREAAKYGGSEEKEVYQSFLESIEELEQTED
jgi:TPR repeat protein